MWSVTLKGHYIFYRRQKKNVCVLFSYNDNFLLFGSNNIFFLSFLRQMPILIRGFFCCLFFFFTFLSFLPVFRFESLFGGKPTAHHRTQYIYTTLLIFPPVFCSFSRFNFLLLVLSSFFFRRRILYTNFIRFSQNEINNNDEFPFPLFKINCQTFWCIWKERLRETMPNDKSYMYFDSCSNSWSICDFKNFFNENLVNFLP